MDRTAFAKAKYCRNWIVIGLSSTELLQNLPSCNSPANGDLISPLSSVGNMGFSNYGCCLQLLYDPWYLLSLPQNTVVTRTIKDWHKNLLFTLLLLQGETFKTPYFLVFLETDFQLPTCTIQCSQKGRSTLKKS